eukprot:gene23734-26140_t
MFKKKAGAGAGVEESALSGRAGHDVFNFARAVDAFSVRTLRYKGPPTEQIWQAITVGALLDVDFGGADFSAAEEQKQLANAVGSEQCRVRIFGLQSCKLGPEGGKQFAGGMATNTSIVELNLRENRLGPDGGKAFAK